MKPVIIFGNSDFAKLAYLYLKEDGNYKIIGFCVDKVYINETEIFGLPVLAFENIENLYSPEQYDMFVAVGYKDLNEIRKLKFSQAKQKGYNLISYISSRTTYWKDLSLGENCFIMENNTIQPFVSIGDNTIIWSGNLIAHNVSIGKHCFFASQSVVSGNVEVGDQCFVGVNATIKDNVRIGNKTIIGARTLILRDTNEEEVIIEKETPRAGIKSSKFKAILNG